MTRKSPTESATLYSQGTLKKGNDGNMWIVSVNVNGFRRWKLHQKINEQNKITKNYYVIDNRK